MRAHHSGHIHWIYYGLSNCEAIKHFCGRRKIKQVYSDDGPELINACVELKLNHDLSLPGRPQNNSLAERTNQFIIDQTSACLVHAGLPTCYWACSHHHAVPSDER